MGARVAEVADWLGLSDRRVKELRANGVLPGLPGEPYDLRECVRCYCAHIRPASGKAASGGSDGAVGLDAARVRLLTAQAEAREMLNEQMRGETVLAEDMEAVVGAILDAARTKILAVPTKASPLLVGLNSLAEVREKLTGLIHAACDELADAVAVCASILDRARSRAGRGATGDPPDEAVPVSAAPQRQRVG